MAKSLPCIQKKTHDNDGFAGQRLSCTLCHVQHTAKTLHYWNPAICRVLVSGTRQTTFLSCARSRHKANDEALPCALDLAHGKVRFRFCKQSRMGKLSKQKL